MEEVVIDGTDFILGRLASYAAKLALEGKKVIIYNCEKVVVTGDKNMVLEKFLEKRHRGNPHKGPFYPRAPDRIVRRVIRGMLPRKKKRGRDAFKRVMCYIGVPEGIDTSKALTSKDIPELSYEKLKVPKYVYLGEISKMLGWKGV